MSNKARTPELCKALQPLTQNGIINAKEASTIVGAYMAGNCKPIEEIIVDSKSVSTMFLPLINELKKFLQ